MVDLLRVRQTLAARAYERYRRDRRTLGRVLRDRLRLDENDTVLARVALDFEVMVYFSDPPVNLYQIRQWLYPLEELDKTHRVFVLARNNDTFQALVDETTLPVVNARRIGTVDSVCFASDFKLALYVNQSYRNFSALRYPDMFHVYLSHGDSEKTTYTASNQAKAYDFVFVAGEAAVDRYRKGLVNFDVEAHVRVIGRPQLDTPDFSDVHEASDRTTVLYAPTWEGDRPSTAYGSVESHGPAIVDSLLRSSRHRLIYRPHPRTGWNRMDAGLVDTQLRRAIRTAAERHPEAGHRVDVAPHFGPQIVEADVMICDVSAVAMDFLPTGKPLVVTQPARPEATVDRSGVLGSVYDLTVADASRVAHLIDGWVANDVRREDRARWVEHYFGDITPGASMRRFLDACEEAIQLRDKLVTSKRDALSDAES
jgi:hypothetical protein